MTDTLRSDHAPDNTVSNVLSPAGVYLVSGLLVPFLTQHGQDEIAHRWNTDPTSLAEDTLAAVHNISDDPALHAALGVWTRDHEVPADAAAALNDYLRALPLNPSAAQSILDRWAADHTNNMIKTFPLTVTDDTHCVLASAIAIEDTWAREATATHTGFHPGPGLTPNDTSNDTSDPTATNLRPGVDAPADPNQALLSDDGTAVRVTLPLTSGAEMTFCLAEADTDRSSIANSLHYLHRPEAFNTPAAKALTERPHPAVSTRNTHSNTNDVAVIFPEFTTRSSIDLLTEPETWGLTTALDEGVPGLGAPGNPLKISDAKQDAFIEVTHTGVRAAAVTALGMMRGMNFAPPPTSIQTVVTFDRPFAYTITHPALPVPLFDGIYAG